jgi:hemoglobin
VAPEAEATGEKTPYELLGGDDGVRQLVADFYELMDALPEAAPIRAMHEGDLSEMADKLGTFLIGWMGGPQRYQERFGRVIIPLAHRRFSIGMAERDQWLLCMESALGRTSLDMAMKARLMDSFGRMAEMCRNKD